MPIRVLLSLKPQFAAAILSGEKKFEFRRDVFSRSDVTTVVLYASSPVCKVVGEIFARRDSFVAPRGIVASHKARRGRRAFILLRLFFRSLDWPCAKG